MGCALIIQYGCSIHFVSHQVNATRQFASLHDPKGIWHFDGILTLGGLRSFMCEISFCLLVI